MSEWNGDIQARLDGGEGLIIWPAVHVKAKSYATDEIEAVGFSKGNEILTISLDGEARTYLPAGDALSIDGLEVSVGLTIQGQRITVNGINSTIDDLQRVYNLNSAEIDVHDIAFSAGFQFLGARRKFKGFVDGTSLSLDDRTGGFSLVAVSSLRQGTRTFDAVLDEVRDPIFKYVRYLEGDKWG